MHHAPKQLVRRRPPIHGQPRGRDAERHPREQAGVVAHVACSHDRLDLLDIGLRGGSGGELDA